MMKWIITNIKHNLFEYKINMGINKLVFITQRRTILENFLIRALSASKTTERKRNKSIKEDKKRAKNSS